MGKKNPGGAVVLLASSGNGPPKLNGCKIHIIAFG